MSRASSTARRSSTAATARAVADGFRDAGLAEVTHHDVLESGFDPNFGAADLAAYRDGTADLPEDVAAEQRRLEGYDVLAVVFPVY